MIALEDLFSVHGLVAVITGGGSGIGPMAAKALDTHGAKAVCKWKGLMYSLTSARIITGQS